FGQHALTGCLRGFDTTFLRRTHVRTRTAWHSADLVPHHPGAVDARLQDEGAHLGPFAIGVLVFGPGGHACGSAFAASISDSTARQRRISAFRSSASSSMVDSSPFIVIATSAFIFSQLMLTSRRAPPFSMISTTA